MLLRHGKSDWDGGAADDFTRPLAKRGHAAAKRMGAWMRQHRIMPDYVISSPAVRARETAVIVGETLLGDAARVAYEDRLYLADVDDLLSVVGECPQRAQYVMLIGHNPGLEDFLIYLCGEDVPVSANGKLLPTAALAQIGLSRGWRDLKRHTGHLIAITRPKEL